MDMAIEKLWGVEIVTAETEEYTGKILVLNPGFISSIHRHPVKKETFYILDGIVNVTTYDIDEGSEEVSDRMDWVLHPGFRMDIPPGTWHSFRALVPSRIIETSTPHKEEDVERFIVSRKLD